MGTATADFDLDDFRCKCSMCAENPMRPATKMPVIQAVQSLRDYLSRPLIVTCGVRCPAHNQAVGGAPDSRHLPEFADAVDIYTDNSREADQIMEAVYHLSRFTVKEVCAHHIHLDQRPGIPRCFPGSGP